MSENQSKTWTERLTPGRRTLAVAGMAGVAAWWWRRRQQKTEPETTPQDAGELTRVSTLADAEADTTAQTVLPPALPECCVNVLGRPRWYDRELLRSVKIRPANAFVRAISSPQVAGTEITATTIGDTIYFRQPEGFDPHAPAGLALLAHEVRHVEQYREHGGIIGFALDYIRQYRAAGYGTDISFEKEAYEIGSIVQTHLTEEFTHNDGESVCRMTPAGEHGPNLAYAYLEPYPDLPKQV